MNKQGFELFCKELKKIRNCKNSPDDFYDTIFQLFDAYNEKAELLNSPIGIIYKNYLRNDDFKRVIAKLLFYHRRQHLITDKDKKAAMDKEMMPLVEKALAYLWIDASILTQH